MKFVTGEYTGWAKKVSLLISAIIFFDYYQPIFIILAHVHYRKFVTRGHIVCPLNVVCVTTLRCKIVATTFFCIKFYTLFQNSPVFTSVVIMIWFLTESYLTNIRVIFKWWVLPCSWVIIAMAAADVTNVNFGFKQFMTDSSGYLCSNKSFMTMDNISIMCRNAFYVAA